LALVAPFSYSGASPGDIEMRTAVDRVTKTPGICGGDACIHGTRIPVWVLVNYRRLGGSDAEILQSHPSLTKEDLQAAWDYASGHKGEIDTAIRENEEGEPGFVE